MLLAAYSIAGGSSGGPFQPIYSCDDERERDDDTTCYDGNVIPPDPSRHYDSLIESTATRDSLLSTVTKAEGGSVGTSVSTGASYMSEKSDASHSISFMIGGFRATTTKRPRHPGKLKLTDDARKFLKKDAPGFLETYGDYYVKSITYGGSFMGSYDYSAESSADSADLQVEAKFKYKSGVFTAKGSTEFMDRQSSTDSNLRHSSDYISVPDIDGPVIDEPYDLTLAYDEWNEKVDESPAPLYVNIGSWWDSQDVQNVLNDMNQTTRDLFTKPILVSDKTMTVATNERVSSEMMMNALDGIREWPEVTSNNTLSDTAEELFKEARSYSTAYTSITDHQLAYLQSQIISDADETEGIDNPYNSWLYYEKSLGPRYAEFMKSMPAVPDIKMDLYRNKEAFEEDHDKNPYRFLMSSTPIVMPDFKVCNSFYSPRIPTEDMKLMDIFFSVNPYNHKVSEHGIEDGDTYDSWEARESFWVYDSPAEGLTQYFVYRNPTEFPNLYIITTDGENKNKDLIYTVSFYARKIS